VNTHATERPEGLTIHVPLNRQSPRPLRNLRLSVLIAKRRLFLQRQMKPANRTMAVAAKRRQGVMLGKDPATMTPAWRPFQLAFILMNLPGISDPTHADRNVVDLLFFPTVGGKTEAYLGLAAFTLVLRRLRNAGVRSSSRATSIR